jgi:uncharacterized membrane protein
MAGLLLNFRNTMIVSSILAIIFIIGYGMHAGGFDLRFWQALMRYLHVVAGILWIGILYYFNFVQIRKMPEIPAELKPGITKYIAPEALFWFRYSALFTVIFGVILAYLNNYLVETLTLGASNGFANPRDTMLGAGMWLAIIMFLNVWVFIWPNQKIALGIVEADADAKLKAGRIATLFSRTNALLSLPMLTTMAMTQTLFGS